MKKLRKKQGLKDVIATMLNFINKAFLSFYMAKKETKKELISRLLNSKGKTIRLNKKDGALMSEKEIYNKLFGC